jgi:hypothetical protein
MWVYISSPLYDFINYSLIMFRDKFRFIAYHVRKNFAEKRNFETDDRDVGHRDLISSPRFRSAIRSMPPNLQTYITLVIIF